MKIKNCLIILFVLVAFSGCGVTKAPVQTTTNENNTIFVTKVYHEEGGQKLVHYGKMAMWENKKAVYKVFFKHNGKRYIVDNYELYSQCVGHEWENVEIKNWNWEE